MSGGLQDALGFRPVPERRLAWRKRWRGRWPFHAVRIASNVLASVGFLVLFLPLPVKLVGWLTGSLAAFSWWMVVVLMAAGALFEWVSAKIDGWGITRVMKAAPPSPSSVPPQPFPATEKPLCCPSCGETVRSATPLDGFFACRCGALLFLKGGEIDLLLR
ncbi:MAG: hypothetical protein V2A58_11920 [Planctomycetota bacterium]